MKPINIYTLTRINNKSSLRALERHMSGRNHYLNIKEWEIIGIRKLIDILVLNDSNAINYKFYYSFQLPKLGKEFDLLMITSENVINIEIKSNNVSDNAIRKQLLQNRHYLTTLGRTIYSYTYISEQDRLVRLTNTEKLIDTDFINLNNDLKKCPEIYDGDIAELFKEDKFLISPLTDPERFLKKEYFLTSQQRDIENRILRKIAENPCCHVGFTGLPGTGKTILLYDIALKLSKNNKICVLHFGSGPKELELIDLRLKRIDFYSCNFIDFNEVNLEDYHAILVDEGHRINKEYLKLIYNTSVSKKIPLIFSYDREEEIAPSEIQNTGNHLIESIPDLTKYRLTNRIRVNSELSAFIGSLMMPARHKYHMEFSSVNLAYANNKTEAANLICNFISNGFTYIRDLQIDNFTLFSSNILNVEEATCKELSNVVMLIDKSVYYNEAGMLVSNIKIKDKDSSVRNLFHGLSRAKNKLALVIMENEALFNSVLDIL